MRSSQVCSASLFAVVLVAGCSGGTTTVTPRPRGTPTPAPSSTPVPTQAPTAPPTATPAPTPVPSPTPAGGVALNPSTLNFITTGSSSSQTTTASETSYSGSFTAATTTCGGIATISPATSSATFTVTPQGNGTCSFTISGAPGQSATLNVTVTLTSGTIQSHARGNAP